MAAPPSLRNRMAAGAFALLGIGLLGTVGFYLLGRAHFGAGEPGWSLGACAYFTIITITTVGYAELPHLGEVPFGRLFTALVLIAGLGVALYTVTLFTSYFIEGEFLRSRWRRKMTRALDSIRDHIIVCGVGTTGIHVVEELIATGWPVVAVDVDEAKLERLQGLTPGVLPTVHGDATEDEVLVRAGVHRARGLVAALTDDKFNLYVVVTARELSPRLKIVAKGVDIKAAEKLRRAGADRVVNPAFIGGVRLVSEMIRPEVVEFLDLMLRDKDKNLRIEEVLIPTGSPLVGKPIAEAQIRKHTNLLVVAVREASAPDGTPGRFVYNPGPETSIEAGMALIVLGETTSVHKLRDATREGFAGRGP